MGNQSSLDSSMKEVIEEEFEKVRKDPNRDYLNIQEVGKF